MESPEWLCEENDTLAEESANTTPNRRPSAFSAEPIKKTRLFSLANSPKPIAATGVIRSPSTQLNSTASSFDSSQNLNIPNLFFESDYPSRRFRPKAYEEEDPADPYYSPPSTFIPPESPNDLIVQGQPSSAVLTSETQVRDNHLSISSTLTSDNSDYVKSTIQGTKASTYSCVRPSVHRTNTGFKESRRSYFSQSLPSFLSPCSRHLYSRRHPGHRISHNSTQCSRIIHSRSSSNGPISQSDGS